ncbi:septum site-determining protein MinC [Aestuariirhabdus sp. Z084]|uniref:septum site-determining protein MinC n=1 Tax=Aestuariirhabdus haliotis TaxID=2918751 RepID=UPI00201B3822|nr:septum site-determining protein MinC [Aestuariirhabdus haliotis]MCL6417303.1 septum site-determining protein MinC [Aestuariirhabdus haliotis]MCL6421248.1 septum site-determining protein MinC [Aestuariirhabdus haliotis]
MNNTASPTTATSSLQFKAGLVPIMTLELHEDDLQTLAAEIADKAHQSPAMFDNTPVILALDKVPSSQIDIAELVTLCDQHGLRPIAVRGATTEKEPQIKALGLSIFTQPVIKSGTAVSQTSASEKAANPQKASSARIVSTPVRSGQQILAPDGDLIVTAPVSAGAELLARGNIHVYGALRGRALAGIQGDEHATVFCHSLEAELVSIAGHYRSGEPGDKQWKQPARISLCEQKICIDPLF